jgi:hypothetical protein
MISDVAWNTGTLFCHAPGYQIIPKIYHNIKVMQLKNMHGLKYFTSFIHNDGLDKVTQVR